MDLAAIGSALRPWLGAQWRLVPVVALATVAGHLAGYSAAGLTSPDGHHHLDTLVPVTPVLGLLVLLAMVLRARTRRSQLPMLGELIAWQTVSYLALEAFEGGLFTPTSGHHGVATSLAASPVLWGLLAQPVVALGVWALLHAAFDLTCRMRLWPTTPATILWLPPMHRLVLAAPDRPHSSSSAHWQWARGPPQ